MGVSITCYGGVGAIGGNKILLEDGDTRVLLDFGTAFKQRQEFFNEYLRPRAARGLLDLLALGLIPPLEGAYQLELAPPGMWERFRGDPLYRSLWREGAPPIDAVLVSHAHLDHNGDLSCLDPAIPIYTTRVTAFIARAMQITGLGGFESELTFVCLREWDEQEQVLKTVRNESYRARNYSFLDGQPCAEGGDWWEASPSARKLLRKQPTMPFTGKVHELEVRWWPVDHSVPGAVAFAIHTSAGWVGYTGDIRFHGQNATRMEEFAQELARLELTALLCEGTHLSDEPVITEQQVAENALTLVQQAEGRLVVADFAPRNVERLSTFHQVARETGRRLAIQPKDAYLLQAIAWADPATFPDPLTLPELVLYADPKSAPRTWETKLRRKWSTRLAGPAEVSGHPGEYILCFSLWDANDLLDLQGIGGGVYIYSNSRAYDEEQAIDLGRLRNWIRHVELRMEGDPDDPHRLPLHASGHATGPQLRDYVRRVCPRMLIPIHTEQPCWWQQALAGTDIQIVLPQVGQPIFLP
ncbi:MAG: MBL fold metallo-hydrolase [Chloroflexi bacterium]|nr:MBL fold metallo-hydrolase [Chloroflexota bacterium]